ncbi:MAG: efflux RND transporter periplasmic adaptor subunit [Gammaproteobacteria bacterium]|nr:efflux RND transporter periplasmic adaptor subunit [Gammaproteobacteria bacterium]
MKQALLFVFVIALPFTTSAGSLEGRVQWYPIHELGFPINGVVSELLVSTGQQVKKGDVLARLDQRTFTSALDAAIAKEKATKTALEEAQREHARAKELFARTLISEHELFLARFEEEQAEAAYKEADSTLAQARFNMEFSEIRAPNEGIVLSHNVHIRKVVNLYNGTPTHIRFSSFQSVGAVSVTDSQSAASLTTGQPVVILIGKERLKSKVSEIRFDQEKTIVFVQLKGEKLDKYLGSTAQIEW